MLAAVVLAWLLSIGVFLGGLGVLFIVFLAGAMDPLGRSLWATSAGGLLLGAVMTVLGLVLLALLIWG